MLFLPGENVPMFFQEFNKISSIMSPSTTHCQNTTLVHFLEKYLIQRVMSVFDFTLPDEIDQRYFKWVLFLNGWIILTYDDTYGALAHYGTIKGRDLYWRPKETTISIVDTDPTLCKEINRTLIGDGQNAVLMSLQEDYSSIMDLVSFYAEKIALLYESFDTNVLNSHLAYVFGTDSKALANTFKKLYDNIAGGETACVVGKDLFDDEGRPRWTAFFNNLRANYIGGDILMDLAKIRKEFDTEIGIENSNTDKRERITTDEVNSNNLETLTRVEMWRDNMNSCLDRVAELFDDWRGSHVELRTVINPSTIGVIEGVTEGVNVDGQQ